MPDLTREESVLEAQRLHEHDGHSKSEVARRMGVPYQTASSWLNDPDLVKQTARRAERYAGRCACGARTDGSNGRERAPTECYRCRHRRKHDERYWTRERIIQALHAEHAQTGRVPSSHGHQQRGARPVTATVQAEFGSWSAGIQAAGMTPLRGSKNTPKETNDA
jgi:transposase